jgi:hypothetical protein
MSSASAIHGRIRVTINAQYRTRQGRVYELSQGTDVLSLHIARPEFSVTGDWHVEGRLGIATGGEPLADGWGNTRVAALDALAAVWKSHSPRLVAFDWEAVASELRGVQAV